MRIWSAPGAEEETDNHALRAGVLPRPPARPSHVYPRASRASEGAILVAPPTPFAAPAAPTSKPEVASCTRLKISARIALASSDD